MLKYLIFSLAYPENVVKSIFICYLCFKASKIQFPLIHSSSTTCIKPTHWHRYVHSLNVYSFMLNIWMVETQLCIWEILKKCFTVIFRKYYSNMLKNLIFYVKFYNAAFILYTKPEVISVLCKCYLWIWISRKHIIC